MSKIFRIFSGLLVLTFAFIIAGCGQGDYPPPSLTRSNLILELFSALKNNDSQLAIAKIQKLRKLEQSNVFIAKLEIQEQNNLIINKVQKDVDAGKIDKAIALLKDEVKKYDVSPIPRQAIVEVEALKQFDDLIEKMNHPVTSQQLAYAIVDMRKLIKAKSKLPELKKYKLDKIFKKYLANRKKLAEKMEKIEDTRAEFDLVSETASLASTDRAQAESALACLALDSPSHPAVKRFMKTRKISPDTIIPGMETKPDKKNADVR